MNAGAKLIASGFHLDVRALALILREINNHYGGLDASADEKALTGVALELADRVDSAIRNMPEDGSLACSRLWILAGPCAASIHAAVDASRKAAGESDEDRIAKLADRAGWLKMQAAQLAHQLLEAVSAEQEASNRVSAAAEEAKTVERAA